MRDAAPSGPKTGLLRAYGLAFLLALSGLTATLWVSQTVDEAELADARHERAAAAQERVFAVQQQLRQAIRTGRALSFYFQSDHEVTGKEFTTFASSVLENDGFAQAVTWAPVVPAEHRSGFEHQAQEAGAKGFAIVDMHPSAGRVAAGGRPEYVPIRFVEPMEGHQRLLGVDLSSDPKRRGALEQARDSGQKTATPPIHLVRSKELELGFDVITPVYEGEPDSVEARRGALKGYTIAEIDVARVLDAALMSFRHDSQDIGVELLDADAEATALAVAGPVRGPDIEQVSEARVNLAGRTWIIRAYGAPLSHGRSWVLPTGLTLTAMLVAYAVVLIGRKTAVEKEVAARTLQLEQATRRAQDTAERLASLNAALMQRNKELDEFLFVASHDLQEPSRRIGVFVQLLERGLPEEAREGVARHIEGLKRAAERLQLRIKALHALSEVGRGDPELSPVRLDDCVDAALQGLNGHVHRSGAEIQRGELPIVVGDARLLRRVYEELIDNAVRFAGPEEPVVALTATREADSWVLGVKDEGPGIAEDKAEAAFAPFRRLQATSHGEEERPGIGLTIARRAVDRMGGEMWLESTPGAGTHVRFRLPARPES